MSLNIIRGDDVTITVTCTDADGVAIDITGYTVFFTAKSNINDVDADAVISETVTSHTNPTGGITQITLSAADTADLTEGDYIYDFQLKNGAGAIQSSSREILTVSKDVTIRTV